jgi:23S rRNA (guanosine2251-2'-O)-methyltransferase
MEADKLYTDNVYDTPVVLVIGSEGEGMRQSTRKHCDLTVKIPMKGQLNSLNASVSAGILLFEIQRQRNAE